VRLACADDTGNVITKLTKASRCGAIIGGLQGLDFAIGGYSPSSPPPVEPPLSENWNWLV